LVAAAFPAPPRRAPAAAKTRSSPQSRRGPIRWQLRRRWRFRFWTICPAGRRRWREDTRPIGAVVSRGSPEDSVTICQDSPRRAGKDIRSIGAGILRQLPEESETIGEDTPQRSAKNVQPIRADVLQRSSKALATNHGASLQRSPKATSRLLSNPWRPNTQARPRNFPPTQQRIRAHFRICVARVNHNGGALPSFGHFVCAIRPRAGADMPARHSSTRSGGDTAAEILRAAANLSGEPEMSEAAREFLDRWMSEHVGVVPDEYRLRETVRLVALCREDAIRAGVDLADLRAAAGGNLLESILAALSAATAPTTESVA